MQFKPKHQRRDIFSDLGQLNLFKSGWKEYNLSNSTTFWKKDLQNLIVANKSLCHFKWPTSSTFLDVFNGFTWKDDKCFSAFDIVSATLGVENFKCIRRLTLATLSRQGQNAENYIILKFYSQHIRNWT